MDIKRIRKFAPITIMTILALANNLASSCPTVCVCKWKGGKRRVECTNKGVTVLLSGISPDTQVLDYSENHLQKLPAELFQREGLINLQKLFLSGCRISQIHEKAFKGLANLIQLDLSDNALIEVPYKTFLHYPLLMKLSLSHNPIRKLRANSFFAIPFLTNLDLSDCQIEDVDRDSFEGLSNLQWLKLHGNRLKNINHDTVMPNVSGGISLHPNPWRCDCYLRVFLHWLLTSRTPLSSEPICEEPSTFRGIPVKTLETDDLACLPYIVPSSSYVEIEEGRNISFVCQVSAIPEATISWEFEGIPVNNSTSVVYPFYKYYVEDGNTEKFSELFIFDSKIQNNGTYKCIANNIAGSSSSNFTVRILYEEGKVISKQTVVSYVYIMTSSIVTLAIILAGAIVIFCIVYYRKKLKNESICKSAKQRDYGKREKRPRVKNSEKFEANPDLISNTDDTMKDSDASVPAVGHEPHPPTEEPDKIEIQKLYCDFEFVQGNEITVHVNPLENQVLHQQTVTYPCGCFYPILQQNDILYAPSRNYIVTQLDTSTTTTGTTTTNVEPSFSVITDSNFRCNLEGYPFPRKSSIVPLQLSYSADSNTPILSPPDPFKTD